jgi:hypothetical protein
LSLQITPSAARCASAADAAVCACSRSGSVSRTARSASCFERTRSSSATSCARAGGARGRQYGAVSARAACRIGARAGVAARACLCELRAVGGRRGRHGVGRAVAGEEGLEVDLALGHVRLELVERRRRRRVDRRVLHAPGWRLGRICGQGLPLIACHWFSSSLKAAKARLI